MSNLRAASATHLAKALASRNELLDLTARSATDIVDVAVARDIRDVGERLAKLIGASDLSAAVAPLTVEALISGLETGIPIVVLPVRIETRFREIRGQWTLLIRIFPDSVHVDQHLGALTVNERDAGRTYWGRAADSSQESDAWAALVAATDSGRAAWIRRSTASGAPDPGTTTNAFARATQTTLLPDRFCAVATRDGKVVVGGRVEGQPVRRPLSLGPDPALKPDPDGLDRGSRWLVDFDEAERVGMAIRMPLGPSGDLGVDRLVVYGVAGSYHPAVAAQQLAATLDAHHFTDGMELLARGTSTNNHDAARSSWSSRADVDAEYSHRIEVDDRSKITPATGAAASELIERAQLDGARLARAFGVPVSTFDYVAGNTGTDDRDARAMLTALWPGTAGYGIRQFLGSSINSDTEEALRRHATAFVRSGGPFAALRVGRQPYGILPVTSFSKFQASTPTQSMSVILSGLRRLRDEFRRVTPVRMGRDEPTSALAKILAMSPVSVGYRLRREADAGILNLLGQLAEVDSSTVANVVATHAALAKSSLRAVGLNNPGDALNNLVSLDSATPNVRPLVQIEPLSASAPLVNNYLTTLRTTGELGLLDNAALVNGSLLALLLRASVLSQYLADSMNVPGRTFDRDAFMDRFVIVDLPNLPGIPRGPAARLRDLLGQPTPDLPGTGHPGVTPVNPGRRDLDVAGMFELIRERIDPKALVVDGLDGTSVVLGHDGRNAWPRTDGVGAHGGFLTGFQPRILPRGSNTDPLVARASASTSRTSDPVVGTGRPIAAVRFGTTTRNVPTSLTSAKLGIPEMLAAIARLEVVPSATLERLLRETLDLGAHRLDAWLTSLATQRLDELRTTQTSGVHLAAYSFVHDLRPTKRSSSGGFVHAPSVGHAATAAVLRSAHMSRGGGDELAIDLRSQRVRRARRILDAVRAGGQTGQVLGAWVEERLVELGAPAGVGPCRRAAPLRSSLGPGSIPGALDGEALLQAVADGRISADSLAATVSAAVRAAVKSAITTVLSELREVIDAIGDLLLAESVHHLVQRNSPRAAAAMGALSGGVPPQDYDVLRITPPGVGIEHRAVAIHRGPLPVPATTGLRAILDPFTEAWANSVVGPLDDVAISGEADGRVLTVSAADLGLGALDVVTLLATPNLGGHSDDRDPLTRLLIGALHSKFTELGVDLKKVAITFGADNVLRCRTLAQTFAGVLSNARPIDPTDVPGQAVGAVATGDVAGLRRRLEVALKHMTALIAALDRAATSKPVTRSALAAVAGAGVGPGAVPAVDATEAQLAEQCLQARSILEGRRTSAMAKFQEIPAFNDGSTIGALREVAATIIGAPMIVTLDLDAVSITNALENPPTIDGSTDGAVRQRQARSLVQEQGAIRVPMGQLRRLRQLLQGLGRAPEVDLGQIGPVHGVREPWVGLGDKTRISEPAARAGRTSLLRLDTGIGGQDDTAKILRGVILDEWNETVPETELTSALAVHANRPSNEAPQAILLAVPPIVGQSWTQAVFEEILNETFELAQIRAVDLPALQRVGQLLPMLHLPLAGLSFNFPLRWNGLIR